MTRRQSRRRAIIHLTGKVGQLNMIRQRKVFSFFALTRVTSSLRSQSSPSLLSRGTRRVSQGIVDVFFFRERNWRAMDVAAGEIFASTLDLFQLMVLWVGSAVQLEHKGQLINLLIYNKWSNMISLIIVI